MESLEELIPLASAILDGGLHLEVFSGWKQILVWAMLGSVVSYHYYAFNYVCVKRLDYPAISGVGVLVACRARLMSNASAIETAWERSLERSTRPIPRDLFSRRNF